MSSMEMKENNMKTEKLDSSYESWEDEEQKLMKCVCKCGRCANYAKICADTAALERNIYSLDVENQKLVEGLKEKEDKIEDIKLVNCNLKKDCYNLFNKVCVLNQEKFNLLNEIKEAEQKLKKMELAIEFNTEQVNACKSLCKKYFQELREKVDQAEIPDSEVGDFPLTCSSDIQTGINNPLDENGTGSAYSNERILSGYEGMNVESLVSVTSVNFFSQTLQKRQKTLPQKKVLKCNICLKTFSRPCALASHARIHGIRRAKK